MRERGQAIEEAGGRDRQAYAGLFGEVAGDRGGIAGILLMAEGEHTKAFGLRHPSEIGDRNARHAVNRLDVVELERVDDEMKTVGELLLSASRCIDALYCCGHSASPWSFSWVRTKFVPRLVAQNFKEALKTIPGHALRRKRQGLMCGLWRASRPARYHAVRGRQ